MSAFCQCRASTAGKGESGDADDEHQKGGETGATEEWVHIRCADDRPAWMRYFRACNNPRKFPPALAEELLKDPDRMYEVWYNCKEDFGSCLVYYQEEIWHSKTMSDTHGYRGYSWLSKRYGDMAPKMAEEMHEKGMTAPDPNCSGLNDGVMTRLYWVYVATDLVHSEGKKTSSGLSLSAGVDSATAGKLKAGGAFSKPNIPDSPVTMPRPTHMQKAFPKAKGTSAQEAEACICLFLFFAPPNTPTKHTYTHRT